METSEATIEAGPNPTAYREGSMGWFIDEPRYGFPDGGGMRTRLTAHPAQGSRTLDGRPPACLGGRA
jgi:hypothetical protein